MTRTCFVIFFLCMTVNAFCQHRSVSFDIIRHLDENQGAFSNTVYQVAFDRYGNCYLATNKGLGSYNGTTLKHLSIQGGINTQEIYNLKIKGDLLYFLPLKGGLYYFNYQEKLPVCKKKIDIPDVLKDIVIRDSTLHISTYNFIFSSTPSNIVTRQIYFSGTKNRVYEFENNFYLKSANSFSKFDITTNTTDSIIRNRENIMALCVSRGHVFYSYRNYFYSKNLASNQTDSVRFSHFPQNDLPDIAWPINDSMLFLNINSQLLSLNVKTGLTDTVLNRVDVNNITYNALTGYYYVCTQNEGLYILARAQENDMLLNSYDENISYLSVSGTGNYNLGFENGELIFKNKSYVSSSAVNTLVGYKNMLFIGLDKGYQVIDLATGKKLTEYLNSTVKRAIGHDSIIYYTGSKSFIRLSLTNFSYKKIIESNHRSYYAQKHDQIIYTQSYNTDSLFRLDPSTNRYNALGSLKGQVIKSIQIRDRIYFLTDAAYLYWYDQKQLTGIRVSDYILYPVAQLSYFEQDKSRLLIGNNQFFASISIDDLLKGNYHFKSLNIHLPKDAKYAQVKEGRLYYAVCNTIRCIPLEPGNKKADFYYLRLRDVESSVSRDNIFSKTLGHVSLDMETINYSGKNNAISCFVISNGQVIQVKKNVLENTVVLDSLPMGASHILCFAIDNRLNHTKIISIPIFLEDRLLPKIILTQVCYSLCILLLAFLIFRYILTNLKKQHALRMELVMLEQKAGALLLNPHFVFNALGNIQAFIGSKQLKTANTYLLKFSLVIRSYINFMKKGIVTLSNELESINHFIEFQNIKYGGRLELLVVKATGVNTETIHIPAFVLQPFVENSIKYFRKHPEILSIEIHISTVTDNQYTITIHDNGPGLENGFDLTVFNENNSDENAEFKSIAFTLQRLEKVHAARNLPFSFSIKNRYNGEKVEGLSITLHLSPLPEYQETKF